MRRYACFTCPRADHTEHDLNDECSICGKPYGFPLVRAPAAVLSYRIIRPLSRGFYAATYVAERGTLRRKVVLKVVPRVVMEHFSKDFDDECRRHAEVADGADHIVEVREILETAVDFQGLKLECHIAELDYVEGEVLGEYLRGTRQLRGETATQIAIDLLHLLEELQIKRVRHNDLHADNIVVQELTPGRRRADAVDGMVRAVAIDLGSLSDASRSDSNRDRYGDLQWIAIHLRDICEVLLTDPDGITDRENRVANALLVIGQGLSSEAEGQRTPSITELVETIKTAHYSQPQHWRPWRERLMMKTYSASYNAQTMQPWHVPFLLVDPDDRWRNNISAPGPQVIMGMRGCGKTMLLRSLQLHARAAQWSDDEGNDVILERLKRDNYVGLFVSAQRLLDPLGANPAVSRDPFVRLFVSYALEALRAVVHLRDIDGSVVAARPHRMIADTVATHVGQASGLRAATSEYDLEDRLGGLLLSVIRGGEEYSLGAHPSVVFPKLAEAVRQCSDVWANAQVLFLLDDVSTRYLDTDRIEELLSALLFQDPACAFKLTSEAQTIYPHLRSPGQIHLARVDRDLRVFDLGAKVYEKIKNAGDGNNVQFLAEILRQRAHHFAGHPSESPEKLLGSVSLQQIATDIATSRGESKTRKGIYRGIRALAGMCVGDIGDVIGLYEQILRAWSTRGFPIPANVQSECFQDFCARRLYDLNRRGGVLMDTAKAFAEASNSLLMRSARKRRESGGKGRLRQYSAVYVRVTTGDKEKQMTRLRELVDAGVFVFGGGSSVPRSKSPDSNPAEQFRLTYRKIYGLVNFIGLSDRDRFELSGTDLEEWIDAPANGREVLLRNQVVREEGGEEEGVSTGRPKARSVDGDGVTEKAERERVRPTMQGLLFGTPERKGGRGEEGEEEFVAARKPVVCMLDERAPSNAKVECVVLGLGFEERSKDSVERLLTGTKPRRAVAIAYEEEGHSDEIRKVLEAHSVEWTEVQYAEAVRDGLPRVEGGLLVDITGLAKPLIFDAVRNELRTKRRVWICHTEALTYYPRDADLGRILAAWRNGGRHGLLEELPGVLTGEVGPYECKRLLDSDSDESRQRALFAFATAKHERLLSLLDKRAYDRVEIVVPDGESTRSRVAGLVGEIAAMNYSNSKVQKIGSNDLDGTLRHLTARYKALYVDGRQNFEVGLTGSKLQAVACAAASATFKLSQGWYLQPKVFDVERFTAGVGRTTYYEIRLQGA